jgi:hypothetical protein
LSLLSAQHNNAAWRLEEQILQVVIGCFSARLLYWLVFFAIDIDIMGKLAKTIKAGQADGDSQLDWRVKEAMASKIKNKIKRAEEMKNVKREKKKVRSQLNIMCVCVCVCTWRERGPASRGRYIVVVFGNWEVISQESLRAQKRHQTLLKHSQLRKCEKPEKRLLSSSNHRVTKGRVFYWTRLTTG